MGWLFSPNQIFAADSSLVTMNLSLGERPVCEPVVAANAPLAARIASLRARACSTRTAGARFQLMFPKFINPYSSRALLLIIIVIAASSPLKSYGTVVLMMPTMLHTLFHRVYNNDPIF